MSNKKVDVKIVSFVPLTLYTDTNDDDGYATLSWSIRKGYPRITVYTDNSRKKSKEFSFDHLITAPMDAVIVNVVIDNLGKVIKSDKEIKLATKCYNVKYVNNEKTDDIYLQATIIIGKDKDGVIYMTAVEDGKRKVKFKLLPREKWHKFINAGGNEVTDKSELSVLFATAYHKRLKSLMDKHLADDAVIKGDPAVNKTRDELF